MKSEGAKLIVLAGFGAVMLFLGIVMTAQNFVEYQKKKVWISDKLSDLEEIAAAADSTSRIDAALARLEADSERAQGDLSKIASESGIAADINYPGKEPAVGGWFVQRANVVVENAEAESLAGFIFATESRRPPWRVTACAVRALPDAPGSVRATISLKALRK